MGARPLYFLVRPGVRTDAGQGGRAAPGPMVPLIPVDELPEWLEVVGVPRALAVQQTAGMSNLGTVLRGAATYEVRVIQIQAPASVDEAEAAERGGLVDGGTKDEGIATTAGAGVHVSTPLPDAQSQGTNQPAQVGHAQRGISLAGPQTMQPSDRMVPADVTTSPCSSISSATSTVRSGGESLYPTLPPPTRFRSLKAAKASANNGISNSSSNNNSSTSPTGTSSYKSINSTAINNTNNNNNNSFCRHWCHHGTCRWGVHCRYQHSMPTTADGLAQVGLKDFPLWWKAAMGLSLARPSPLAGFGPIGAAVGPYGLPLSMGIGMGVDMNALLAQQMLARNHAAAVGGSKRMMKGLLANMMSAAAAAGYGQGFSGVSGGGGGTNSINAMGVGSGAGHSVGGAGMGPSSSPSSPSMRKEPTPLDKGACRVRLNGFELAALAAAEQNKVVTVPPLAVSDVEVDVHGKGGRPAARPTDVNTISSKATSLAIDLEQVLRGPDAREPQPSREQQQLHPQKLIDV